MSKEHKKTFEHWEVVTLLLMIYDFMAVAVSYFAALWVRFDCKFSSIETIYLHTYYKSILFYAAFCVIVFWFMRLYKSIWRFASYSELMRVTAATLISSIVYAVTLTGFVLRMPISYFIIGMVCQFITTLGIRFSYRFILLLRGRANKNENEKKVMLIGAGAAGQLIFRDIKNAKETNEIVACFIDDNPNKWGRYIDNVPVFGGRDRIMEAVEKFNIDKIYMAIPSAKPEEKRDILSICSETSCELMNLPGMYQLYTGEVSVSRMKKVQIEDLLGRDPVHLDNKNINSLIKNKTVLVTGGGGSIGSELCRQIVKYDPKRLVILDIYENNLYDIEMELRAEYPKLNLEAIVASVRDKARLNNVFETYKPEIVFHAAAHKHVPLMEKSPLEAIHNNVFGTYNVVNCADEYGVEKFVLISTDKAVNPTNIMGASKRVCEMIVQAKNKVSKTEYVAVRFGNVLGSNGSVIPLFKKQIERGGPVTVTHKDITRFFMTIPEAVQLILQAVTYAKGGEIFVLDMGEPVKIVDLATNLIKLSGYKPGEDIEIKFTGLRPGEKMYEELLMSEEGLKKTANKMIYIGKPIEFDDEVFQKQLDKIYKDAYDETDRIREDIKEIVPTYQLKEQRR